MDVREKGIQDPYAGYTRHLSECEGACIPCIRANMKDIQVSCDKGVVERAGDRYKSIQDS